ncbi:PRC-barrel domain-containing protein [Arthrobacter sp. MPF02]|uniref:PRC-barrel domain-containing protein n=1 Tax=Arthrobacter sp. MPF02 TaxID=3388492 RepID=UPI00398533EA
MLNRENIEDLLNRNGNVIGSDGETIGPMGQLYADDDTGEPTWVTVKTGLFGTSQSFVPVEGAHSQGNDLVVPYTKEHVKDAPRVDVDGHLTPEEEDRLYTHYDRVVRTYSDTQNDVDLQGDADLNAGTPTAGIGRDSDLTDSGTDRGTVGDDTSVGARLRKYVTGNEEARKANVESNGADGGRGV